MDKPVIDMAELPVQLPEARRSTAPARARFFSCGNAFNVRLPRVPAVDLSTVAQAAGRAEAKTGLSDCDQSAAAFPPPCR